MLWAVIGAGSGAILTPTGNVLRRSSAPQDRPAVFAAQFSLSHACWLLAYPIAGWGATVAGYSVTWMVLAGLAGAGACAAVWFWPAREPVTLEHVHPADLTDLDHVRDAAATSAGYVHTHTFVIDDLHRQWPQQHRSAA